MPDYSLQQMEKRLVRYADLRGLRNAFIDTRTPGSDKKENFTIIGPGVSENPAQFVHIAEPHGFNIGAARQPGGCLNSQHSHLTAEVFVVHTGKWRLIFGAHRDEGTLDIEPGDVVSVPTNMFRGFEKRDEGTGFLFVILGQDDPGKVMWAPEVFDLAEKYGLKLLKGGKLVDTVLGESVPEGAELEQPPTAEQIEALKTPPLEKMLQCYVPAAKMQANPQSKLAGDGVEEAAIIGTRDTDDGFKAGPLTGWWEHGFTLRQLRMQTGATVAPHARQEREVLFVQEGTLEVGLEEGSLIMGAGDTLSIPVGVVHSFRNPASCPLKAFIVRGGDNPALPIFATEAVAAAE